MFKKAINEWMKRMCIHFLCSRPSAPNQHLQNTANPVSSKFLSYIYITNLHWQICSWRSITISWITFNDNVSLCAVHIGLGSTMWNRRARFQAKITVNCALALHFGKQCTSITIIRRSTKGHGASPWLPEEFLPFAVWKLSPVLEQVFAPAIFAWLNPRLV